MPNNNITIFEELTTGQAFEYEGKIYFKATSQNNGEDCGFCMEDADVRFIFPKGVKELPFANYDINKSISNKYHKTLENNKGEENAE